MRLCWATFVKNLEVIVLGTEKSKEPLSSNQKDTAMENRGHVI